MASLESPMLLSAKEFSTKVLGFCSVPDSEQILITHDSEVDLIQPYDGKLIRSWNCPSSKRHQITGSAIFYEDDQEFVVIQNKKTLRTMKLHDFSDTATFTVNYSIHCIISHPGMEPVVVFEDGSLFFLDDVLEDPKKIKPQTSVPIDIVSILSVETITIDDGNLMVLLMCQNSQGYYMVTAIMKPNEENVRYLHTPVLYQGLNLVSACTLNCGGKPSFAVLWSDGSLTKLRVYASFHSLNLEIDKVANLQVDKKSKIVAVSPDQGLILSPGGSLQLFDMTFGSILERISVNADVNQVFVVDDLILLDSPNKIQKIQFTAHLMTLAQAIMKSSDLDTIKVPCQGTWTDTPTQTALFSEKDQRLIRQLLETKDHDSFTKNCNELWTDKTDEFKRELCHSDMMRRILSKLGVEDDKKDFWPRSALQNIISSGHIPGRWCHGLFLRVLHDKDWELAQDCIVKIKDIPEYLIVRCIISFMSVMKITHDLVRSENDAGSDKSKPCVQPHWELHDSVHMCMKKILILNCTEVLLRDELVAMPFSTVQNFIIYLTEMLEKSTQESSSFGLNQVIYWLNLVLDSHISDIVMLEDCWPMIERLQRAVEIQSEIFKELAVISNLLTRIECKLPNSGKKRSLYLVEIMRFG